MSDNQWSRPALASCFTLRWMGGYLIAVFLTGILLNSLVLHSFLQIKQSQSPIRIYMIALSIANLAETLLGIPLSLSSNLACPVDNLFFFLCSRDSLVGYITNICVITKVSLRILSE